MKAIVTIDVTKSPDRTKASDMRYAALELTNNRKSIRIRKYKFSDHFRIETEFAIKPIAQYKVVDRVFHDFEYAAMNWDDYLDISVTFQR